MSSIQNIPEPDDWQTRRPNLANPLACVGKWLPQMNAATPQRRPATEEISGLIERVTFHNDESGFCVLRVKVRGQRDETTVVGSLPSVTAGEWLSAEGWWVRDKEHGLWANLLCRAKTQKWVEMGEARVEQVSSRGCHLDSAVPTTKLHSFAEL